ncbi:acyltransferase [Pseudoalteromonas sp. SG45-5]|uniref:acyltransferase n=1 Tax=unclassified Pseudoalteromonas TaxID=194690 RepID=UPI0015FA573F|nr:MULTISPECIES: acyltransferase [unclassified Pseudoalteromonas]MBB1385917.1 acyltransferase [Pseudoalteromonas sp. SG45-5]MBB1393766.1 acyltransferase [Pseudoalteromonas sp. SG44-4]MBB1446630.1 acyltransferase [Pseudoalteromonas sp. SG41-6]
MMVHVKRWLKNSPHPFAKSLFHFAKNLRNPQMIVIPLLHSSLYHLHQFVKELCHELLRIIYYTPLFKSQIKGSKKQLFLYSGMPQVLGQLNIECSDNVRMSGISTFCGRVGNLTTPTLIIGNNVDIGWQNAFSVGQKITLEDDVRLAGRVFLAGFPGHPIDCERRAQGDSDDESQIGDIIIKRGAWLGTGVTVLAGVTIGEGAIIGAGSVVTKNIPAFTIAAGNPAKVVKHIKES